MRTAEPSEKGSTDILPDKKEGIYVNIPGEPLLRALEQCRSGTGRPGLTKPFDADKVIGKEDRSLCDVQTEIRRIQTAAHAGHILKEGPQPTGLRYCMNSAALRFIPKQGLAKEGYGEFLKHFEN